MNKTKLTAAFIAAIISVSLCGCGVAQTAAPTETIIVTAPALTAETSPSLTEATEITSSDLATETAPTEEMSEAANSFSEDEKLLFQFLDSLKNGTGAGEINAQYDFLDDFTLDSYSYVMEKELSWSTNFDVTLNVSESNTDFIPVGDSTWRINVGGGAAGYINEFFPIERAEEMEEKIADGNASPTDSMNAEAVYLAKSFSLLTGIYDATEEELAAITDIYAHGFYHILPRNPEAVQGKDGLFTPAALAEAINHSYGIAVTEDRVKETMTEFINDDGYIDMSNDGHGLNWNYVTPGAVKSENGFFIIDVDFYGDNAYAYAAKTCEYKFAVNEDSSLTLKSAATISDYGYEPAVGSV